MSNSKKNFQPDNSNGNTPQYNGKPLRFFLNPFLLGILLCNCLVPGFLSENKALISFVIEQDFERQLKRMLKLIRERRSIINPSYSRFYSIEMCAFITEKVTERLTTYAFEVFKKMLTLHEVKGGSIPENVSDLARDAADFLKAKSMFANGLYLKWDFESMLAGCKALEILLSYKPIKTGIAAAVREANMMLSYYVPQLIFEYIMAKNHGVVGQTALSNDIESAIDESDESFEQQIDRELDKYLGDNSSNEERMSTGLIKVNNQVQDGLYGGKKDPIRALMYNGSCVYSISEMKTSQGGVASYDKLNSYNKNLEFVKFLHDNNFTVQQLLDYTVDGSHVYLGLHMTYGTVENIKAKIQELGISLEDNVIEVVRAAIRREVLKKDRREQSAGCSVHEGYKTGLYRGVPMDSLEAIARYIEIVASRYNKVLKPILSQQGAHPESVSQKRKQHDKPN